MQVCTDDSISVDITKLKLLLPTFAGDTDIKIEADHENGVSQMILKLIFLSFNLKTKKKYFILGKKLRPRFSQFQ